MGLLNQSWWIASVVDLSRSRTRLRKELARMSRKDSTPQVIRSFTVNNTPTVTYTLVLSSRQSWWRRLLRFLVRH
jgi:hypothetical protein